MTQILQPYEVAIVNADVELSETLLDVFYNLERLEATIGDIFGRVERRIGDERVRLDQINNRIATCHGKVNDIRGSKKATTVFSTAKFPAPKKLPAYPTLFSQMAHMSPVHRQADEETRYFPADPEKSLVGNNEATDDNLLLLTRLNVHGSDMERVEFVMEDEGLGPVPEKVDYVGSLLLFNSAINPYKNYTTLDNLVSSGRAGKEDIAVAKGLASAPATMTNGDLLPDIQGIDLTFKPEMGQMADLQLPSNLPLDFLADINYEGDALPSIAPSAAKANYSLPQITDGGYKPSPSATEPMGAAPPAAPAAVASTPSMAAAPPPPPPAPPPAPTAPPAPPSAPVTAAAAAPPPPPPPAAPVAASDESDEDDNGDGDGGARNPLLAAIQGMSVNKLRKKTETAVKTKKVEAKPVSMMDDLQARMMRRNSAITGKENKMSARRESQAVQMAAARAEAVPPPPSSSGAPKPPSSKARPQASTSQPPPPSARPKSVLHSIGFADVDDNANDSDNEPAMPTMNRAYNDDDTLDSSDDSSTSDISDVSMDEMVKPAVPTQKPIVAPAPAPAPAPIPVPMPQPSASAAPPGRRGSLLDDSNKDLNAMLTHGKGKNTEDNSDDDDDDDWD